MKVRKKVDSTQYPEYAVYLARYVVAGPLYAVCLIEYAPARPSGRLHAIPFEPVRLTSCSSMFLPSQTSLIYLSENVPSEDIGVLSEAIDVLSLNCNVLSYSNFPKTNWGRLPRCRGNAPS